jgi:hypothetical protein
MAKLTKERLAKEQLQAALLRQALYARMMRHYLLKVRGTKHKAPARAQKTKRKLPVRGVTPEMAPRISAGPHWMYAAAHHNAIVRGAAARLRGA